MRKPIIVGNWKMNHGIAETKEFVAAVDGKVTDKADWGIATPFLDLATAKEGAKNLIVALLKTAISKTVVLILVK